MRQEPKVVTNLSSVPSFEQRPKILLLTPASKTQQAAFPVAIDCSITAFLCMAKASPSPSLQAHDHWLNATGKDPHMQPTA